MIMDVKTYKDKVRGCWLGKNVGGTLGAPIEGRRGVYDLDFYTQDMTKGVWPNDDLDLQIAWLAAAERYGRGLNSEILGEYWLNYVVGDWSEYGAGKNNMTGGLMPPVSGWYENRNKNSCGAFIRSEIWACLAPGHPEIAVKYALCDAVADHASEGVYGEIFCAAVQSAAFAESDPRKLIETGLSYIPEDCGVARAITIAIESYDSGLDWKAARRRILTETPCAFGQQHGYVDQKPEEGIEFGEPGYDAPANVGITIIGWLYGENDFGKSLCIAAGCGEDADCTAGTLGAILGIISGADKLPEKWLAPIGDEIKTISLNLAFNFGLHLNVPSSVTELTGRVCALMPVFMERYCDTMCEDGTKIILSEGAELCCKEERMGFFGTKSFKDVYKTDPIGVHFSNASSDIDVCFVEGINVKEAKPLKVKFRLTNHIAKQQWLSCRWIMPEDWTVSTGLEFSFVLDQVCGGYGTGEFDAVITPGIINKSKYELLLIVESAGRIQKHFIPVTLINNPV